MEITPNTNTYLYTIIMHFLSYKSQFCYFSPKKLLLRFFVKSLNSAFNAPIVSVRTDKSVGALTLSLQRNIDGTLPICICVWCVILSVRSWSWNDLYNAMLCSIDRCVGKWPLLSGSDLRCSALERPLHNTNSLC